MSYFKSGFKYIIVPDLVITEDMQNNMKNSVNSTVETSGRTKESELVQKTLFKVKEPVSDSFNGYTWHNDETIRQALIDNGFQVEIE